MTNTTNMYLYIIGPGIVFIVNFFFFFLEKSDAVGPNQYCEKFNSHYRLQMEGVVIIFINIH